jgi:DNA-binding NarL/FixJ family response regulator
MGGKVYHMRRNDNHFQRKITITMTDKSILALVVSSSGPSQNGLLALMTTIPPISAVLVAEEVNSALRMVENHQPALIILDMAERRKELVHDVGPCSLKVQDVIKQIKTQWPHIHLIVLVEDIALQKEAETSGADSALLKGFSAQKLVALIEDLLSQ